jgi:hypothetical protein
MISGFGSAVSNLLGGPNYTAPDPNASPLDQSADLLQQRVKRANQVATSPFAAIFAPEQVQAARDFVPKAVEALQTIEKQKADIAAGRRQAATLGLDPGEVSDQATKEDRITAAQARALKGDLKAFQGLQAVDPKAAEAIQDQVHSAVAANLDAAQSGFDKLANARNPGQYEAALRELRQKGDIAGLESLGLKVPERFDQFNAFKGREAEALRNARIGVDTVRQKLEDRNTYQPMEEKEAKTYNGRMTTAYGDQITNGTWSRNSAAGTRGLVVNGADDPRNLQKTFTLATPEQRTAIEAQSEKSVPKVEIEKARTFARTYKLATTDAKGNPMPEGTINTNPNVQQGVAEGLASMLRGGSGGATGQLLKIETSKRGFIQALIDKINTEKGAAMNELKGADVNPYLSKLTQGQIRDVMDVIKGYNDDSISSRMAPIAKRAGALGLDASSLGVGAGEIKSVDAALEEGRQAQIARMTPYHQAIGSGDGVFQIGAQRPGAGASTVPGQPTTQLPGAPPLQTPVQQATNPPPPRTPGGGNPPDGQGSEGGQKLPTGPAPPGGPAPVAPPTGGNAPGRAGVPPGMTLDSPAALDAAANRTMQIESGFKTGQRTGSYVGLGQWSKEELARHGITNPDDIEQNRAALKADIQARAAKLQRDGLPATAANVYLMHQQGEAGLEAHLRNPDKTAWENIRFGFRTDAIAKQAVWGNMTPEMRRQFPGGVDTVTSGDFTRLWEARYNGTDRTTTGAAAGARMLASGNAEPVLGTNERVAPRYREGTRRDVAADNTTWGDVGRGAIEHAPAIGSTIGAGAGTLIEPGVGTIAGGGVGGAAGQSLKDWLLGNTQNPVEIAKQGALGAVLGVAPEGRPAVGALTRTLGAGAVEGGAKALEGGDTEDVVTAAGTGLAYGLGGEAFGRALGMGMHKIYSLFTPDAQKAVRAAAADLHEANEVLKTEPPKIAGAAGTAATANPKYEAAQAAKEKAETAIKEMMPNAKPEEVAYAHKVTSEGVPQREAQASRPGELERQRVGAGYQQLETEHGLPSRPTKDILTDYSGGIESRVKQAMAAPAASPQERMMNLKDIRSAVLDLEADAMKSTSPLKTQIAKDMRAIADKVRLDQGKSAMNLFGTKRGQEFISRLKALDVRYRNVMEATNGGDLETAAALKGAAGRAADKAFRAFAQNDPVAIAAWNDMRVKAGNPSADVEKSILSQIRLENVPGVGKYLAAGKSMLDLNKWMREKAAGSPAKFEDFVPELKEAMARRPVAQTAAGSAVQRAVVQEQPTFGMMQ